MSNEMTIKAKWIADLLMADGITADQFGAMSDADQRNVIEAYMDEIGRRISKIQGIYLTRPGAREAIALRVAGIAARA